MRLRQNKRVRSGSTLAEGALVIGVFLMLTLGVLDVGVGVFRFNTISQAARHGARQAVTHGALAPSDWRGGKWGTTTIEDFATNTSIPAIDAVGKMLVGVNKDKTKIKVEWPDSGDAVEQKVRVTVTTPYKPLLTWFLGGTSITLTATATMPITH